MASIPIHNETDYTLTDAMMQDIVRDAHEQFGEEVHAIRVQSGLERHAFNARTHEVRFAFSPQDFGFGHTMPITPEPRTPEPPRAQWRFSRSDAAPEANLLPAALENVEEDMEPLETSLESLDEGQDDDEAEDVFTLDDQNDDEDDEEDQEEDDEVDNVFDPDEV